MTIAVDLPESIVNAIRERGGDPARATLEAVTLESVRAGLVTPFEVQQILNLDSRWETEDFLKSRGVYLDYTESDLESDIRRIRESS